MKFHLFINDLFDFLQREMDLQNKAIEDIWKLPIKKRVELGEAIANAEKIPNISSPEHIHLYTFKIEKNNSKFREGDRVCLNFVEETEAISNFLVCSVWRVLNDIIELNVNDFEIGDFSSMMHIVAKLKKYNPLCILILRKKLFSLFIINKLFQP